jgi:hypothetical protein
MTGAVKDAMTDTMKDILFLSDFIRLCRQHGRMVEVLDVPQPSGGVKYLRFTVDEIDAAEGSSGTGFHPSVTLAHFLPHINQPVCQIDAAANTIDPDESKRFVSI